MQLDGVSSSGTIVFFNTSTSSASTNLPEGFQFANTAVQVASPKTNQMPVSKIQDIYIDSRPPFTEKDPRIQKLRNILDKTNGILSRSANLFFLFDNVFECCLVRIKLDLVRRYRGKKCDWKTPYKKLVTCLRASLGNLGPSVDLIDHPQDAAETIKALEDDNWSETITEYIPDVPARKYLLEACKLYQEVVVQDLQALKLPIAVPETLPTGLSALTNRLLHLRYKIDNLGDFIEYQYPEWQKDWDNCKILLLQFCDNLEKRLVNYKQINSNQVLKDIYTELTQFPVGVNVLNYKLTQLDIVDLKNVMYNLLQCYSSIKILGLTVIIDFLLKNNQILTKEISKFTIEVKQLLINLLQSSQNFDHSQAGFDDVDLSYITFLSTTLFNGYNRYEITKDSIDLAESLAGLFTYSWVTTWAKEDFSSESDEETTLTDYDSMFDLMRQSMCVAYNNLNHTIEEEFKDLIESNLPIQTKTTQDVVSWVRKNKPKRSKLSLAVPKAESSVTQLEDEDNNPAPRMDGEPLKPSKPKLKAVAKAQQEELAIKNAIVEIHSLSTIISKIPLQGAESEYRLNWQNAALLNLEEGLDYLEETLYDNVFSRDKIFGETYILSRLLESVLEAALAHYAVVDENGQSILHKAKKQASSQSPFPS